jgi:carbonic anhydrase/acetyltransferase-like protein (isoleucine patch superfamily)
MELSFKLTDETITMNGETLYRIEATRNIPSQGVKKGDKGGFVSSERLDNGEARISGDAWVADNARVSGNAWVYEDAQVYGDAQIYGNARVSGNAMVYENSWVYDSAWVCGDAQIYGNARVYGNAWVYVNARVYGNAKIDSLDSIIVLTIPSSYHVTVTRDMIFAGCKSVKRSHVKNMTCKEFVEMGGRKEYFRAYKEMVLGSMKIVRKRK